MQTRNIELTNQWVLITSGPVSGISFEPARKTKYAPIIHVVLASAPPDGSVEGHSISGLTNADLDAGENLYARAGGSSGLMIITDAISQKKSTAEQGYHDGQTL